MVAAVTAAIAGADARVGPFTALPRNGDPRDSWNARHRAAFDGIAHDLRHLMPPITVTTRGDLTKVRGCGITASSVRGTKAALLNWCTRADACLVQMERETSDA